MQNRIVCNGCRSLLLYPGGASSVCCSLCRMVTAVPPVLPLGMEMARLICGGCRTLLMHARGATSVRCSCCQAVNLVPAGPGSPAPNTMAHVNCGNCRTTLMYPAGAPSVKCAICQFVTNVGDTRVPIPVLGPGVTSNASSTPTASHQSQTVVVQNPSTIDESGKLVNNVVVGVTT